MSNETTCPEGAIAIIGMDCRFPGANNTSQYWQNLVNGKECITRLTEEQLLKAGISEETLHKENYVRAAGLIDGAELFDAEFFGYTPTEAMHMDPQQCLFLESCWHALEDGGYNPYTYPGAVAVYGGTRLSTYYVNYMAADLAEYGTARFMQSHIGTDRDHLCTRISYKLNLRGPAFNLQCACSTSLVGVHLAVQALLNGECDMALAGASAIDIPQEHGHFYQEGMIFSPDGHCRPYDASAEGIVSGSGVGVVLLKRLDDALRDRDDIHAVVLGSAVNNDGSSKVAYAAPSLEGQSEVIAEALGVSGVDPSSIGYVEGHGTGTYLGDPLEVEALSRVYSQNNPRRGYCALGSVKSNVGHLEVAAGAASLIKAVLTLKNGRIAPTCHFKTPNPRIKFEETPFFVNSTAIDWPADMQPRRAAVSSFGVGGTNAHLILEEAPHREESRGCTPNNLLVLSGRSDKALQELIQRYLSFLDSADDTLDVTDLCHTSQEGRKHHQVRLAVLGSTRTRLREELQKALHEKAWKHCALTADEAKPVFLFTGQGAQRTGMGQELYKTQPVFRQELSRCAAIFDEFLPQNLLSVMWQPEYAALLNNTAYTQPALFAFEYAMARMWQAFGVQPKVLAGHSIGEYAAAATAGVFSLEDACRLVAARGRLIASLPAGGGMSAVLGTEEEVHSLLDACGGPEKVGIAAVNGSRQSVLTGPLEDLARIAQKAEEMGITIKAMPVSHAFHSPLMEPILDDFAKECASVHYAEPTVPIISNVTGREASCGELCSPEYWVKHIRSTVRFLDGCRTLKNMAGGAWLEVGPSGVLTALCRRECAQENQGDDETLWLASVHANAPEYEQVCQVLSTLYTWGVKADWAEFARDQGWGRLHLPLYPFQGRPHFVDETFKGLASGGGIKPAASPESLWRSLNEAALQTSRTCPDKPDSKEYADYAELLENFCAGCAHEALISLGAFAGKSSVSAQEMLQCAGIPAHYEQLLMRMLSALAEDGLLSCDEQGRYSLIEAAPKAQDEARRCVLELLASQEASSAGSSHHPHS